MTGEAEPAWVHRHAHEPNPIAPGGDGSFALRLGRAAVRITRDDLARMPQVEVPGCLIVSTGHGVSGPFTFGGVPLLELIEAHAPSGALPAAVDVVSADGFGARLSLASLRAAPPGRPALLAWRRDGLPLTRDQGLVRLIVPTEVDDALLQVKWVADISPA